MSTMTPEAVSPVKSTKTPGMEAAPIDRRQAQPKTGSTSQNPELRSNISDRSPTPVRTGGSEGTNVPKPDIPSGTSPKSRYP